MVDKQTAGGLPPDGWAYRSVPTARWPTLMSPRPLDSIVHEILRNVEISHTVPADECDESKRNGFVSCRVSFELVSTNGGCDDAMDQLLNGAFRLRARYALDENEGSDATQRVCRAIAKAITADQVPVAADTADGYYALRGRIKPSLLLPSAKVWFGQTADRAPASLKEGQIDCARWIASRSGDLQIIQKALSSDGYKLTTQEIDQSLCKGRTLPLTGSLGIKGAFVTNDGQEYVPLKKRTRALQICLLGWT